MAETRNSYSFSLFTILLFLFIFLARRLVFATDTISANLSLSGDQKLTSHKEKYILGFFRPDNTSSNWFIGIWHGKISAPKVVWVANRENPITDPTTSKLMMSNDGNLVLLNQSKTLVWSTNSKNTSFNSTVAIILDTGNFILRDKYNSSKIIWQSFDHPTNTWLPGGKIGLNKVTGVNQHLVSWKDENNPSDGLFSLELDPNGFDQFIIKWNKSVQYWSSGKWNGKFFESVPELGPTNAKYGYEYVNDETGIYFRYWIKEDSIILIMFIDVLGEIKSMIWTDDEWLLFWAKPQAQCQVYALCGPFGICDENSDSICRCVEGFTEKNPIEWGLKDYSKGCVRSTPLNCESNRSRKGDEDKFYKMGSMVLPNNSRSVSTNSIKDCELACLNNCSCTAYSYDNGCYLWFGDMIDLQFNEGVGSDILYLRLGSSEFPDAKNKKGLVVGVVIGGCFVVFLAFGLGLFLVLRKRRLCKLKRVHGGLTAFRYGDLQYITKNFSEMIGKGGFGSVFKGEILNSTVVAVKRLEGISQGDKQFRAEVGTLGTIQHLNLIHLFGFCSENGKKLLVYEYMPMGSLDKHLFRNPPTILTWDIRYQIALGVTRGLLYLHEKCRDCIIHCDIKPENILLDEAFVPKIADFGLAKLLGHDFSRVLTTMRGTIGYLAPEWIDGVAITTKADVYSFGMMLLEIISGNRNSNPIPREGGRETFFPELAIRKLLEGDVLSLLDPKLCGNANEEEVVRACKVSIWCIQDEEDRRPSMAQVVKILEGNLEANMPPIPRWFQFDEANSGSINVLSNVSSN